MAETNFKCAQSTKRTTLCSEGRWYVVNLEKLVYVEAEGRYKMFHFYGEDYVFKVEATMDNVKDGLSGHGDFVVVNRSFIVNMEYVCGYSSDRKKAFVKIKDKDEKSLPVLPENIESHFAEMFKA